MNVTIFLCRRTHILEHKIKREPRSSLHMYNDAAL